MEKKVTRTQQPFTQSPHSSAAKISGPHSSSSVITTKTNNFQSANNYQQSDFAKCNKNNSRVKYSSYSEKDFSGGRGRSGPPGRGGNGFQRRSPSHQQNYEVRTGSGRNKEQLRVTHTAGRPGTEKSSRHGESASHLLNFTYAPLPSQDREGGFGKRPGGYGRVGRSRRVPVHTKEQFLQAHCQFVVKESVNTDEYVHCMSDPDKMVEWENIEQVIMNDEQLPSCPICLTIPSAAKITKCAHVYCWPCMLHYLSLSDKRWAKCPICFDSIEEKDLKSVMTQASKKVKVGDEVTFSLMKRERESLYVRPKPSWKASGAGQLFNLTDDVDDVKYSKIVAATVQDIEDIIRIERRQLLDRLHLEDTESLEASFIQAALDTLGSRSEKLAPTSRSQSTNRKLKPQVAEEPEANSAVVTSSVKVDPNLKAVSYSDAFDDEESSELEIVGEELSGALCGSRLAVSETVKLQSAEPAASTAKVNIRSRNASSTSSSDSAETELLAADLVLPATGTQPGRSSGSKRIEEYYFYQASGGQSVYLISMNNRILAAEYGSMEMAPQTLTATVLEIEELSMTADLRKRLKYLSHLPLYSQFTVCEVALRPPLVSSNTLSHFDEEIKSRKRTRNRRTRTEAKHNSRIQAEERRKLGKYPDLSVPLTSENHFPVTVLPPTLPLEDLSPPLPSLPDKKLAASEYSVPSRQHEVPLTTPYSFAQAMKGNSGTPSAVWPRVQTGANYVRSSGPQHIALGSSDVVEEDGDGEGTAVAAPTFQESFSADFDQMFSKLSMEMKVKDEDDAERKGKRGRDRKKKKQLVLFSTSGQRANP